MTDRVHRIVGGLHEEMISWRRHFHRHPELSFQEKETSRKVAELLESFGLEVRTGIAGYGVTGLLRGAKPGPTIALRADMDALPIQEENETEYRSEVPGVMHACGHDGHMAMLLGAAKALTSFREELAGQVLFLFQPAEEKLPGGAQGMIREGVLDGVDCVFGLHLWSPLPVGCVGICEKEFMAAADGFEVEIIGRGGHGGLPHKTVDPVLVASHVVINLQALVSRETDPLDSAVISVCTIQGGTGFNVIADTVRMGGTVRCFDLGTRERIIKRMREVIESTCSMFQASCRFEYRPGYPPLINPPEEVRFAARLAEQIVSPERVVTLPKVMGGEDFAYYLQQRPGAFLFVGAGNTERGITAPHHHSRFDIDERSLKIGAEWLVRIALGKLAPDPKTDGSASPQ
ncbi:M20 metallopeptidase family protein [Staphylospora marina]|uniref:M20 metallopeptidase family protein n=1 Tax=Staphylospora marina TaxID=2490858 RepID=UPI000F5C2027|nr:M20 family metallopeptidase [Staphylospora marina]